MYLIALILVILWLLGAVTATGGVTIHALLVVAVVLALIRLINQGGVEWVE